MKLPAALLPALAAAAALAACASGSTLPAGGDAGAADAGATPDAGAAGDAGPDAGAEDGGACTASASYGVVDAGDQRATYLPGNPDAGTSDSYTYQGTLNADVDFDFINLQLYAGFGAFANGIAAGTYTLSGDDLNFSTCGLCVLIYTNYNGVAPVDTYLATGGTVTLTSLHPTLSGSFSNMTFEHVTIDPTSLTSTPVGDGCVSSVTALDFSASDLDSTPDTRRKH